jgi:integrase
MGFSELGTSGGHVGDMSGKVSSSDQRLGEHRRPAGHVYVAERKSGRVWYAKWRDADGQHQKRLGPAWVKAYGSTARGAPRWRTADGPKPSPGYLTPDEANQALAELLAQAPRAATRRHGGRVTLREAADEWLRYEEHEAKVKPSSVMDYRNCADRLCRDLGEVTLEDITPRDIERWKAGFRSERRLAGGKVRRTQPSARTIRKYLVNLNGIYRRAREAYGVTNNPVAEVKRPGRVNARKALSTTDFLEPKEVHALIAATHDDTDAAVFATASFCGLRLGELLALRWRAIDFQRSLISVEASYTRGREGTPKAGVGRVVPMAPEVAEAIRRLRKREHSLGPRDLVFLGRGRTHVDAKALRRRFHAALKKAGLEQVRLHDLRHTFGTIMVSRVDPRTLQQWMGHGSIEVTEMYMAFRDRAEDAAKVSDAFRVG